MSWRADQAYENAQRQDFLRWQNSLTWREYAAWKALRWGPFLTGAGTTALVLWLVLS